MGAQWPAGFCLTTISGTAAIDRRRTFCGAPGSLHGFLLLDRGAVGADMALVIDQHPNPAVTNPDHLDGLLQVGIAALLWRLFQLTLLPTESFRRSYEPAG